MKTTTFIALAAALVPSVLGHGFLASVDIDGKTFKGNNPDFFRSPSQQVPSAIRLVDSINPIKGTNNPAINCGSNAKPGKLIADAKPGSIMNFNWSGGSSQHWPHRVGPVMTYLASCGDKTCDKFDTKNAKWFKIDQQGQKPGKLDQWASGDFNQGKKLKVKIPEATPPGGYMVRHEIIALHIATTKGGAEFYSSCMQIKVGKGSRAPVKPTKLVSFPGGYKDTDPGILVPTIFDPVKNYKFPGPVLYTGAAPKRAVEEEYDEFDDEEYEGVLKREETDEFEQEEEHEHVDDEKVESHLHPKRLSRVMASFMPRDYVF